MFRTTTLVFVTILLSRASAAILSPEITHLESIEKRAAQSTDPAGLNAKFKAKGKKFWGSAADTNTLSKPKTADALVKDFGQVTPEYSMKWAATEPSRGKYNFKQSDQLVNWAVSNGKMIRGHTFVWHSALPDWVKEISDRQTLTDVVANHVGALAGKYKGKWDVVNEVLNDDGTLRDSVFSRVLGESFIPLAFKVARDVDPGAVRYINDYNLEFVGVKARAMVSLVNRINAKDGSQMIQGIGSQTHLEPGKAGGARAALEFLASANVREIAITELDIEYASQNDYKTVVNACLNVPKCVSVTSWGVSDADSWRAAYSPLLFDKNGNQKPAYKAIVAAL